MSTNNSLYRQAAIDAQTTSNFGSVFILPTLSQTLIATFVFLWFALLCVFVTTQNISETISVVGWIDTTTPSISVDSQESAGVVKQLLVTNHQRVSKGQTLAYINRSYGEALGEAQLNQRVEDIDNVYQQQRLLLDKEQDKLLQSQLSIEHQLELIAVQQRTIEQQLQKHKKVTSRQSERIQKLRVLAESGGISRTQVEQQELQLLGLKQTQFELRNQIQHIKNQQAQLQSERASLQLDSSKLFAQQRLLELEHAEQHKALQEKQQYVVRAPGSGMIDNLQLSEGQNIHFGQQLFQITPINNEYFVRLAVNAHQVANIQEDQRVNISVMGFSYQKFGMLQGKISRIGSQVVLAKDVKQPAITINQPVYLVDVHLTGNTKKQYGRAIPLLAGMNVSASIQTHSQSILSYVMEPIAKTLEQLTTTSSDSDSELNHDY